MTIKDQLNRLKAQHKALKAQGKLEEAKRVASRFKALKAKHKATSHKEKSPPPLPPANHTQLHEPTPVAPAASPAARPEEDAPSEDVARLETLRAKTKALKSEHARLKKAGDVEALRNCAAKYNAVLKQKKALKKSLERRGVSTAPVGPALEGPPKGASPARARRSSVEDLVQHWESKAMPQPTKDAAPPMVRVSVAPAASTRQSAPPPRKTVSALSQPLSPLSAADEARLSETLLSAIGASAAAAAEAAPTTRRRFADDGALLTRDRISSSSKTSLDAALELAMASAMAVEDDLIDPVALELSEDLTLSAVAKQLSSAATAERQRRVIEAAHAAARRSTSPAHTSSEEPERVEPTYTEEPAEAKQHFLSSEEEEQTLMSPTEQRRERYRKRFSPQKKGIVEQPLTPIAYVPAPAPYERTYDAGPELVVASAPLQVGSSESKILKRGGMKQQARMKAKAKAKPKPLATATARNSYGVKRSAISRPLTQQQLQSQLQQLVTTSIPRRASSASNTVVASRGGLSANQLWSQVKQVAKELLRKGDLEWEMKEVALRTLRTIVHDTSERVQAWRSGTLELLQKPLTLCISHRNMAIVKAAYDVLSSLAIVLETRAAPLLQFLVGPVAMSGDGALPRAGLLKSIPADWELCVSCLITVLERCGVMGEGLRAMLIAINDPATGPLLQCTLLDGLEVVLAQWELPRSDRRRVQIKNIGRGLARCFAAKEPDVRTRAERNFRIFDARYPGAAERIFSSLPSRAQKRLRPISDAGERAAAATVPARPGRASELEVAAEYENGLLKMENAMGFVEHVHSSSESESDDDESEDEEEPKKKPGRRAVPVPTEWCDSDLGRSDLLRSPGMDRLADSLGMAELYHSVAQLSVDALTTEVDLKDEQQRAKEAEALRAKDKRAKAKKERQLRRNFKKSQKRRITPARHGRFHGHQQSRGGGAMDVVIVTDHRTQTRAVKDTLRSGIVVGLVESLETFKKAKSLAPTADLSDPEFASEIDRRFEAFTHIAKRWAMDELPDDVFALMYVHIFGSSAEPMTPQLLALVEGEGDVRQLEEAIAAALVDEMKGHHFLARTRRVTPTPERVEPVIDHGGADDVPITNDDDDVDMEGDIDDLDHLAAQLGDAFKRATAAAAAAPHEIEESDDDEDKQEVDAEGKVLSHSVAAAALDLDRRLAKVEMTLRLPSLTATERASNDGLGHVDPYAKATLELHAAIQSEDERATRWGKRDRELTLKPSGASKSHSNSKNSSSGRENHPPSAVNYRTPGDAAPTANDLEQEMRDMMRQMMPSPRRRHQQEEEDGGGDNDDVTTVLPAGSAGTTFNMVDAAWAASINALRRNLMSRGEEDAKDLMRMLGPQSCEELESFITADGGDDGELSVWIETVLWEFRHPEAVRAPPSPPAEEPLPNVDLGEPQAIAGLVADAADAAATPVPPRPSDSDDGNMDADFEALFLENGDADEEEDAEEDEEARRGDGEEEESIDDVLGGGEATDLIISAGQREDDLLTSPVRDFRTKVKAMVLTLEDGEALLSRLRSQKAGLTIEGDFVGAEDAVTKIDIVAEHMSTLAPALPSVESHGFASMVLTKLRTVAACDGMLAKLRQKQREAEEAGEEEAARTVAIEVTRTTKHRAELESLLEEHSELHRHRQSHAAAANSSVKRRLEARRKKLRVELESLFDTIDADNTGTITGAELEAALPHVAASELQSIVAEYDANGDGEFTIDEVWAFFPRLKKLSTSTSKAATKYAVANKHRAEMQSLLDAQSVVLQEHEAHAATAKSSLKRRLEARRKKLRDELETLFNMIDSDGSGTITGAELQVALPHVAAGELQSLIAEFDTNGDGVFAVDEVKAFFPRLKKLSAAAPVRASPEEEEEDEEDEKEEEEDADLANLLDLDLSDEGDDGDGSASKSRRKRLDFGADDNDKSDSDGGSWQGSVSNSDSDSGNVEDEEVGDDGAY